MRAIAPKMPVGSECVRILRTARRFVEVESVWQAHATCGLSFAFGHKDEDFEFELCCLPTEERSAAKVHLFI